MTLQDIYNQLAYGELRDLFMGGTDIDLGSQGVQPSFFEQYLPFVQAGLTNLHTRFALKEITFTIQLVANESNYSLSTIKELIKVSRIYGALNEKSYEIPLNDLDNPASIRTPTYNTLLIPISSDDAPWLKSTSEIQISGRADHAALNVPLANSAPQIVPINLPDTFLDALTLYIASRKVNTRGMQPGGMHEGNNYYQRYEAACAALKNYGVEVDSDSQNTRAERLGWC